VKGLWRGTAPALLLWVPYTAIQFAALAKINEACAAAGVSPERPPASFAGGAAAAAFATVCTYPLDLLRTVMAAQGVPPVYASVAAAARGTVAARGPAGLFAGLSFTVRPLRVRSTVARLRACIAYRHSRARAPRLCRCAACVPISC
jgi:solute carrier family 25 thiamine pyrophosphate transporter 19